VDSSVLLDIMAPSCWREWSEQQLAGAIDAGDVAINQVVYAEVAVAFASREALERALQGAGIKRLSLPWSCTWLVAEAFVAYRRAGGPRTLPLPDFFIGAHAAASGLKLLTRDPARVRTYFPQVELIAP
jgi:hypothetical protein